MDIGERVTWEDCPICHRPAAVGWRAGHPVAFDCPRGCRPGDELLQALRTAGVRPMVDRLARRRPTPGVVRHPDGRFRTGRPYALRPRP